MPSWGKNAWQSPALRGKIKTKKDRKLSPTAAAAGKANQERIVIINYDNSNPASTWTNKKEKKHGEKKEESEE